MAKIKNDGWDFLKFSEEVPRFNWNPITGCPNMRTVIKTKKIPELKYPAQYKSVVGCSTPDGCSYCYEAAYCNRFPAVHKLHFQFHENRMNQISKLKKPHIVVVGSAGDMWGWADEHRDELRKVIEECVKYPQHFYVFLTKFPEKYQDAYYSIIPFPPNCLFGTTITRLQEIDRVKHLYFDSRPRFIMFEPLLMTFNQIEKIKGSIFTAIHWVVIGAVNSNSNAVREKWMPSEDAVKLITQKAKDRKTLVYHKENIAGYFEEPLKQYPNCLLKWWEATK